MASLGKSSAAWGKKKEWGAKVYKKEGIFLSPQKMLKNFFSQIPPLIPSRHGL